MLYFQKEPCPDLASIIKSYWTIDGQEDISINREKIIPDGYPEMIFHYKDPYRSNIKGESEQQEKYIIAGQVRNHFYLENTGAYGMFAIKFQPWALKALFDIDMNQLTDKVIPIESDMLELINPVKQNAIGSDSFDAKVKAIEDWFLEYLTTKPISLNNGIKATQLIIDKNGSIDIDAVLDSTGISERTLERIFRSHIGLSPKFYSRIIRFAHIFNLVKESEVNWSKITYQAGYYDQSHFIKNFKEFTGEDPSSYGFSAKTMANFFLNKQ